MKYIVILIFSLIMFFQLNAQKIVGISNESCSQTTPQYIYPIKGILFYPNTRLENKPNSFYNFCNDLKKRIYFVEGLEMSEDNFIKMSLKQKHVTNKGAYYIYNYKANDPSNCVEQTNMFINLTIAINLNGTELLVNEREGILKKIKSEDIVSVRRKKSIFRKSVIEVVTK